VYKTLVEMAYSFPLQLYRLASDPELLETYGCNEIGSDHSEIVAHAVDLGLGLRVVLNALSTHTHAHARTCIPYSRTRIRDVRSLRLTPRSHFLLAHAHRRR